MKVFMVGATGLLGSEAASYLIANGHEVKTISLPPVPQGAHISEKMEIIFGDINKQSDKELEQLLKGADVFIFAAGIDERVECHAPVMESYRKYNIAPLERIFPICKKVGIKRAVVLGSYFSYLTKRHPEKGFEKKNKYIMSRLLQEKICQEAADDNFSVCVLELPYIFGTQPGRKPVWTILIEQIKFMDKWPLTMYPKGGTAMLTARQVGQVICSAAEKEESGFTAYPIGMYNMKWKEFLSHVYNARGMNPRRKILGVSASMMKLGMIKAVRDYKSRNIDPGIDPMNLPHIMNIDLFIDPSYAISLGATKDNIVDAITDSIKVSCEAHKGKIKLIDMKAE